MNKHEVLQNYYVNTYDKLCKLLRRRRVNPGDEEDIVQEAFTKALTYLDAFEEGTDFPAWFNVILNNVYNDYRREETLGGMSREEFDEEEFPVYHPKLDVDYKQIEIIKDKIFSKPEPLREVLRLYFLFNYQPLDIFYLTEGLSRKSIRTYISNFKSEMRG